VCVSVCIHMWWVSSFHALLGWVHGRLWLEADEAGTDPCMQENKTFPERKTTEHTHTHTHNHQNTGITKERLREGADISRCFMTQHAFTTFTFGCIRN